MFDRIRVKLLLVPVLAACSGGSANSAGSINGLVNGTPFTALSSAARQVECGRSCASDPAVWSQELIVLLAESPAACSPSGLNTPWRAGARGVQLTIKGPLDAGAIGPGAYQGVGMLQALTGPCDAGASLPIVDTAGGAASITVTAVEPNVVGRFTWNLAGQQLSGTFDAPRCSSVGTGQAVCSP